MEEKAKRDPNPWHKVVFPDTEICVNGEKRESSIIREGFDGERCFVHARGASDGQTILVTAQYLNVYGVDEFDTIQLCVSHDNGKTWSGFAPEPTFMYDDENGIRRGCCDMTPCYHKKTGRFFITGAEGWYDTNNNLKRVPKPFLIPYAVFNAETGHFGKVKYITLPDEEAYFTGSAGCCQGYEMEDGTYILPFYYHGKPHEEGKKVGHPARLALLHLAFDGEEFKILAVSEGIIGEFDHSIAEGSVVWHDGYFHMTIRDPYHGYVASSADGIHFEPIHTWDWPSGEQVPTYCTQHHWMRLGGELYLVYTRMGLRNDHVFRHRAPLVAAKVDAYHHTIYKNTEFVVAPERGARLGNFGVFNTTEDEALIFAAEWMQPTRCEDFGSDNAIWFTRMTAPEKN